MGSRSRKFRIMDRRARQLRNMDQSMNTAEEFWARTHRNGDCTEWSGALDGSGYGCAQWDGRVQGAHRIAYQISRGPIPRGLCVCHRCDNPRCVRPGHLFLGTHQENMADRNRKGRARGGDRRVNAKLDASVVRRIRALCAGGMLQKHCAEMFGVHKATVNDLVLRKTWADVA